ncbi:rhodanese-like domain-containing protein [Labilibacter marinus]|uniref:rhodanese-like domain-containing protein n=1 Tax=Labilibacter marinus TaxID=1477105 RepID=UPI00094FA7BF|nr:rhodanese-like domain-containing protein [Labilibacter marinus]
MEEQIRYYQQKLQYEIDSWDLFESIRQKKAITVIDARSEEAYKREHLPGAINIPHRKMTKESVQNLDQDHLIVTYCDGIGCNASTKGALNMTQLGFKTKELLGGLDWWKRDGYETQGEDRKGATGIACGC